MRMIMTPEQLMKDLLNSESFDELVAYRLKMSLASALEDLEWLSSLDKLNENEHWDLVTYTDYGNALLEVLDWFTNFEDYGREKAILNKCSMILDTLEVK